MYQNDYDEICFAEQLGMVRVLEQNEDALLLESTDKQYYIAVEAREQSGRIRCLFYEQAADRRSALQLLREYTGCSTEQRTEQINQSIKRR